MGAQLSVARSAAPKPVQEAGGGNGWWRGAVIYQVYLRSFQDSDGDGVGDLAGAAGRLPHIASLGVDAVWVSPFFVSPMLDNGYDIEDFRDVDPLFGTLADFDRFVRTAHDLGLKVMIDLAVSHTSDRHRWFRESRASRVSKRADWYVWANPKSDGTPPNNWLSVFGGPAWSWDPRRQQYYLHNFLSAQPDLNFHNTDVQDEILDVARFWLDRGIDGFRLDTVNFYFHDRELRDNPALPANERNATIAPTVNPYNHQRHVFDRNRPENLAFLQRLRRLLDRYPGATTLGEVGDAQSGVEIAARYTAGDSRLHMCYAFDFLAENAPDGERVVSVLERFRRAAPDGWPCWAFSNHDVARHVSRWRLPAAAQRAYATLLMCLPGSACLYQGEELGLPEAIIPFERIHDPYGRKFWPEFPGRDGCRTPMVWNGAAANGGFSDADPWLPISEAHFALAVASQERDPGSTLNHYRRAVRLREALPALARGRLGPISATGGILSFTREGDDGQTVFCAFNLGHGEALCRLPPGDWRLVDDDMDGAATGDVRLDAWGTLVAVHRGLEDGAGS